MIITVISNFWDLQSSRTKDPKNTNRGRVIKNFLSIDLLKFRFFVSKRTFVTKDTKKDKQPNPHFLSSKGANQGRKERNRTKSTQKSIE